MTIISTPLPPVQGQTLYPNISAPPFPDSTPSYVYTHPEIPIGIPSLYYSIIAFLSVVVIWFLIIVITTTLYPEAESEDFDDYENRLPKNIFTFLFRHSFLLFIMCTVLLLFIVINSTALVIDNNIGFRPLWLTILFQR
jgi:hypothetical protein